MNILGKISKISTDKAKTTVTLITSTANLDNLAHLINEDCIISFQSSQMNLPFTALPTPQPTTTKQYKKNISDSELKEITGD